MEMARVLLLDFDTEAESTRRVLECIPADKAGWKPHEKSMSLGVLASHVASLPVFGHTILTTPYFDMSAQEFPAFSFTHAEEAVRFAAGAAGEIRSTLTSMSDDDLMANWQFRIGDTVVADAPRALLFRTMFFNHLIHHRGQLNVYLRLLDISVPGLYGPSADEPYVPR